MEFSVCNEVSRPHPEVRPLSAAYSELRPLSSACTELRPLSSACTELRPLSSTCTELRPLSSAAKAGRRKALVRQCATTDEYPPILPSDSHSLSPSSTLGSSVFVLHQDNKHRSCQDNSSHRSCQDNSSYRSCQDNSSNRCCQDNFSHRVDNSARRSCRPPLSASYRALSADHRPPPAETRLAVQRQKTADSAPSRVSSRQTDI